MPSRLSPLEKEIAARLKKWRRWAGWSQQYIARSLGCERETWAAYEAGRNALPWAAYRRLAWVHRLNPEWLYSGEGEMEGSFDRAFLDKQHPEKARFSSVWRELRSMAAPPVPELPTPTLRNCLIGAISQLKRYPQQASDLEIGGFLETLFEVAKGARTQGEVAGAEANCQGPGNLEEADNLEKGEGKGLQQYTIEYKTPDVQRTGRQLEELLSRVRKKTSQRGQKSALAVTLGVPRQNVTEWLKGRRTPDALSTLRLLELFPGDGA